MHTCKCANTFIHVPSSPIHTSSREMLLVIGWGNSKLSKQLYDVGYQDIVNIDTSEIVIKQMKEQYQLMAEHEFLEDGHDTDGVS